MHLPTLRRPRYADVAATLALFFALGGVAYAVTIAPDNSVRTQSIQNQAVTTPKLADEAVSNAKIVPGAVTGGKVANNSLTLSDLRGINQSGFISFTLTAHSCGKLTFGISGARAGQAALLTWTGSVPTHVVVGPLKVVDSTHVIGYACNMSGANISASHIGVRVVTFG